MIKKENKLIQITLDPEHQELLNSLSSRFHCSKTDIIKQALKIMASHKKHHITLIFNEKNTKDNSDEIDENIFDVFE